MGKNIGVFSLSGLILLHAAVVSVAGAPADFDWSMPDRFGAFDVDADGGVVPAPRAHYYYAIDSYSCSLPPADAVPHLNWPDWLVLDPTNWLVTLDASASEGGGPEPKQYAWNIVGAGLPRGLPFRFATTSSVPVLNLKVPTLGTYSVALTVTDNGGRFSTNREILVKDYLIVCLGDSYSSGQGAPDVPGDWPLGSPEYPVWADQRANRSLNAPAAQAALAFEKASRHSSVTFLHLAASGAQIEDHDASDGRALGGLLDPYEGADPISNAPPLRPQLDELQQLVGTRRIDLVLMTIGGNDAYFAPMIQACVIQPTCELHNPFGGGTAADMLDAGLRDLPPRFDRLADGFANRFYSVESDLGGPVLSPDRIYLLEYPDPTSSDDGSRCFELLPGITFNEVMWVSDTVVPSINGAVYDAATRHGWKFLSDISQLFERHGYCASDHWIKRVEESLQTQGGEDNGTLHPNLAGQTAIGDEVFQFLRRRFGIARTGVPAGPVQYVLTPVALTGHAAPGMATGVTFADLNQNVVLDAAGHVAFLATLAGPGIVPTNRNSIWFGWPGTLGLLVQTGTVAPGAGDGLYFSSLYAPFGMDLDAHLAFLGYLTGAGVSSANMRGIWSALPGPLSLVVREGSSAPGFAPEVTFSSVGADTSLISGGQVAFNSILAGPGIEPNVNSSSLWVGTAAGLSLVVRGGDPAVGTSEPSVLTDGFSGGSFAFSGGGVFEFEQGFIGLRPGFYGGGLWAGTPGQLRLVAQNGQILSLAPSDLDWPVDPWLTGWQIDPATSPWYPDINSLGEVVFSCRLLPLGPPNGGETTATDGFALLAASGGSLRFAAAGGFDTVRPVPAPGGNPGETFTSFGTVRINNAGGVAFVGGLGGPTATGTNSIGLWAGPAGGVKLIARQGSLAPGTGGQFQYLAAAGILFLNNQGEVAFTATPTGPAAGSNGTGVWTTAPDGVLKLIAREGDYLDIGGGQSKQIRQLSFAPGGGGRAGTSRSFNDAGQIVFHAWFTDNSQGIFLATPPPVFTGISVSGSTVNLSLRSAGGWVYSIDSTDSLPAATWTPFITNLTGTGYIITGAGAGGGPHIKVFSGRADSILGN